MEKIEEMKDIAIYGAGGFGREIACLLQCINKKRPIWNLIGFFDDGKEVGYQTEYGKVLGGIQELNAWNKSLSIVLAIGSPEVVQSLVSKITSSLIDFPNILAPDIRFLDEQNYSIGKGNILGLGCLVSCHVHIGDFNVFNGFITIGHDTCIGNYNSFMPAIHISGEVKIGNLNFFGVSSVVLQQVEIGNNTRIGANSLIIKKTKDNQTYLGNPASIVKY